MEAADVVARIRAVGGRMREGPKLWLPRSVTQAERNLILLGLEKFKEEIVALLPPEPPVFRQPVLTAAEKCSRCGLLVFEYDGQFDEVYASCRLAAGVPGALTTGHLLCPWARDGHPAMKPGESRWRRYELKKLSEAAKRESEPIPE